MIRTVYRYNFSPSVPIEDIDAALLSAVLTAENLHGAAQVRLDAEVYIEADSRRRVVDASTPVGRDVNRLFVGYVERVFGSDEFHVERVEGSAANKPNQPDASEQWTA